MPCSTIVRFMLGLVPAWLMAASFASAAPSAKSEAKSDKSPTTVEQIRKALDKTVSADIESDSLQNVLSRLGEEHGIRILLDQGAMQNVGIEPTAMMVEFKAKGVKLRSVLRNMLDQYNLTFGIVGDSLVVSSEENILYRQLKQRISVDLDEVPLNKALKDLSKSHGVSVVVDPRTLKTKLGESTVTLQVDDVPFETVVRLMAEIAGLRPVRMGNVLFVTTEERAEKLKDSDTLVPNPGLTAPGPGMIVPGLPGGLGGLGGGLFPGGPGGLIPAIPNPAAPPPPGAPEPKKDDTPR